jgi:hypothetical protein
MATKKRARSPAAKARHARALRKYTPEEQARITAERHHPSVDREAFETVIRRLVTTPPPKKRNS